jgi:hypothetical protein
MFLNNIEDKIDTSSAAASGETAGFGEMVSADYNAGRLAGSSTSRGVALQQAYDARTRAIDKALAERYGGATSNLRNPYDADPTDTGYDPFDARGGQTAFDASAQSYQAQLSELAQRYPKAADVIAPERTVQQDAQALARQAVQTQGAVSSRGPGGLTQFGAETAGGLGSMTLDPAQQATFLLAPELKIGLAGMQGLLAHSLYGASKMALAQAAAEPMIQPWRGEAGLPHGFREAGSEIAGAFESGLAMELGGRALIRGGRRVITGRWLPEGVRGKVTEEQVDKGLAGDPVALRELSDAAPEDSALRGAAAEAEQMQLFGPPEGVEDHEHLDRLSRAILAAHDAEGAIPPGDAAALSANGEPRPAFSNESASTPHMVEGKPVYFREVNPADVQTDAATFQFKSNGDAAGVTERLKGVSKWDPMASGKAMIWERADGTQFIADGHQRLGLAKRTLEEGQDPRLQSFVFREKDGWTPADVRSYAAMKNLKELSGTALDMARIMRERPDLVDGSLPLSDNKMREAVGLSRLSADAFGIVANGHVPEPYAALVGDSVTDQARHASLLEEMMGMAPQNVQQARLYLGQILALPTATEHQMSLFGAEERTRSLMKERVKVLDSALKSLANEKRIFGLLDREAGIIERAGNELDRDENAGRATRAAQFGALIEKLSTTHGVVSDLLNDAADAMANRGVRTKTAADALVRRIGDILDNEGINGLTRDPGIEQPAKLADPLGPEAEAQTKALDAASDLKELAAPPKEGEAPAQPRMMFALPEPSGRLDFSGMSWYSEKPNTAELVIPDETGKSGLYVEITFPKPEHARIELVHNTTENPITIDEFRSVEKAIRKQYPSVTEIGGRRVTGARADLPANLQEASKRFALPEPGGERGDPGVTLTAAASDAKAELRDEIAKLVSAHLPPEYKAEIRDRLTFGDLPERTQEAFGRPDPNGQFWGHFDPDERVMWLALNAHDPAGRIGERFPVAVAGEEYAHMLEETGLLKGRDIELLDAHAEANGVREALKIDERYKEVYGERYKGDPAALEAALGAETRAQMLGRRWAGDSFGREANGVLDRVLRFLRKVRDMLAGKGFRDVQDVFDRFDRGGYTREAGTGGEPRFAVPGGPDWVEDYAKADEEGRLGKAMDMADANFEKIVRGEQAKGNIKPETAEEVIRMWRDMRRATGSATEASHRVAKVLTEEDKLRRRQTLLQQKAQKACEAFVFKFRDGLGQPDPVRAAEFLLDNLGHFAFPAGMQDVVGRAKSVEGLAVKKMMEMLDYFHPNRLGMLGEKRRMVLDNVIRELKGEDTADVLAKKFAKSWEEVHESLRQRFNAAGGNIAKLEKWGISQVHDRRAMIMSGYEKWRNFIWPRLDREKTVHALTREPLTDQELEKSLRHIYDEVVSDGWYERKISAQRRSLGALANQRGDHRFLHFKSADAWLEYNREFGGGSNVLTAMMHHVHSMANDIGAMEILGPNPEATLERLKQFIKKQGELRQGGLPAHFPTKTQNFRRPYKEGAWFEPTTSSPSDYANQGNLLVDRIWKTFREYSGPIGSIRMADAFQSTRNLIGSAKLGSVVWAQTNDALFARTARKMAGMPRNELIDDFLRTFNKSDAARALATVEKAAHQFNIDARQARQWNTKSLSRYVQDRVLAAGHTEIWSRARLAGYQEGTMMKLAQQASLPLSELEHNTQKMLRNYGISAEDWDHIRMDEKGTPRLERIDPFDVYQGLEARGMNGAHLAERYMGMLMHDAMYSQHLNPLKVSAWVAQHGRGTLQSEFLRGMAQFKTFVGWYAAMWGGKFAAEADEEGRLKGATEAFSFFAGLTIFGVFTMQMKAILSGKDPEPLTSPDTWLRGVFQGGGFGVYGDFLHASENRFGGGVASTLAGPQAALGEDVLRVTWGDFAKHLDGEKTNVGREAVRALKNYVPGSNLWYLRAGYERVFLDNLQRFVDPQARDAFRKRIMDRERKEHSGYWWRPGEMAPERAPDFGNLLRH